MSKKNVKLELTILQAEELMAVAGNGYGDGDYYGNGKEGRGGKRQQNAFLAAYTKLVQATHKK